MRGFFFQVPVASNELCVDRLGADDAARRPSGATSRTDGYRRYRRNHTPKIDVCTPLPPPHLVGVCVCSSRCITKLDASLSDLSNKTQQNATANGCQQPPAPPRPTFSFSRSYDSVTSPVEAGRRKKETRKRCKYCDYETVSETGRLE